MNFNKSCELLRRNEQNEKLTMIGGLKLRIRGLKSVIGGLPSIIGRSWKASSRESEVRRFHGFSGNPKIVILLKQNKHFVIDEYGVMCDSLSTAKVK